MAQLQEENNNLLLRLGQLQHLRVELEDKVHKLEQQLSNTTTKLQEKSAVIQKHLLSLRHEGRASPAMERDKAARASKVTQPATNPFHLIVCLLQDSVMGSLFRASPTRPSNLDQEIASTMSNVLEDTLLKNIQLKASGLIKYLLYF
jgi:hypothetical protein